MTDELFTRGQLIESTFNLSNAPANALLLLRIVTDDEAVASTLERDIQDLYHYPERLTNSYMDEWRSWIKRALRLRAFNAPGLSDALSLQRFIEQQYRQRGAEIEQRFATFKQILQEVKDIEQASNVHRIKTVQQSQFERLGIH